MSPAVLKPSKLSIALFCVVIPFAFIAISWVAFCSGGDGEVLPRIAFFIVAELLVVLAAYRIFESHTVLLDNAGVECIKFMEDGKFFVRRRLQWSDIVQVTAKEGAYILKGMSFKVRVRPVAFNDPRDVITFMRARLPPHLADKQPPPDS